MKKPVYEIESVRVNRPDDSARKTRIITVQGPLQLLNVISVLRYQQEHEGLTGFNDVLLIGGLSDLQETRESMLGACMEILKSWNFSAVVDLTPIEEENYDRIPSQSFRSRTLRKGMRVISKQIEMLQRIPRTWKVRSALSRVEQRLASRWRHRGFADAVERLRSAVGSSDVEYVYVSRNTQFVNELTLSAFLDTIRICYGDGLGFLTVNNSYGSPTFNPRGFLPMHRACLIAPVEGEPGHLDLMELTIVPHRFFVDTLSDVADQYEALRQRAAYFSALSKGLPITIVLTSYLTEYGVVTSAEDEVALYRERILAHVTRQELILVKGHPREAYGQSELLAGQLREAGFRCSVMSDTAQFPIELFAPLLPIHKVVNFGSSGFLGILIVRQCPVVLGLGAEAYRKTVKFDDKLEPIRSEKLMILLAQQAYAGEFLPIRLTDEQFERTVLPDFPTLMSPDSSEEIAEPRVIR